MRIWPLLYCHEGERLQGIARHQEPTDAPVSSNIFSLMENSWEGQLSSLALSSMIIDDYSRSQSFFHSSILMLHLGDNTEYWPQGQSTQPNGLYSIILPWWLVDYYSEALTENLSYHRYFSPIVGYDAYARELKLLNLYFRKYQSRPPSPNNWIWFRKE